MTVSDAKAGGSVERVRAALLRAGHPDTIVETPAGARTAIDAAAAVGCDVAQIVKSLIFRAGDDAVLVVASGANRVDTAKIAAVIGRPIGRADAAFVREKTGFAIGGVAPLGHLTPPITLLDRDLLKLDTIWAAAGSPHHVFRTDPPTLLRLTGAREADVAEIPHLSITGS